MTEKHQSAWRKRIDRYSDFETFISLAERWFQEFGAADSRHEHFDRTYSFYVRVGGRYGGVDKRIVEVFYGNRPVDSATEVVGKKPDGTELPVPQIRKRLITERGAALLYQRSERGYVTCTLIPASSESYRRREDLIILKLDLDPRLLTGKPTPYGHWQDLISYSEVSSVDGHPAVRDRLRVWWLLFTRRIVVKNEAPPRQVALAGLWILKWVVTVGLSGALLFGLTRCFPEKRSESDRPASRAAANCSSPVQ